METISIFKWLSNIHKTAIIDDSAIIGDSVKIGAYVIVGKDVKIGKNTVIHPHAIVADYTTIGENCQIFSGAVIGSESQDLKAFDERSYVVIGNNNIIREYVTINRASNPEQKTIIGDNNLLMAYVHVAHDCILGNNNILANSVNLGGHCIIENNVVIGGLTGIHQFVRVGSYSMIGGLTRVTQDVPPFFTTVGNPSKVESVNLTGLKRNEFSKEKINLLRTAYDFIYRSELTLTEALDKVETLEHTEEIIYLLDFFRTKTKRGISGLYHKS